MMWLLHSRNLRFSLVLLSIIIAVVTGSTTYTTSTTTRNSSASSKNSHVRLTSSPSTSILTSSQRQILPCDVSEYNGRVICRVGNVTVQEGKLIELMLRGDQEAAIQHDSIEWIYMKNSSLKCIPGEVLKNYPQLVGLSLGFNGIQKILEKDLERGLNLIFLYLDYNMIDTLSDNVFAKLKHLEILGLDHNNIQDIHVNAFTELNKLTELRLNNNRIQYLNETTFDPLANLQTLYLGYNELDEIEADLFYNNTKLMIIALNNNNLSFIPGELFYNLKSLQFLNLSNNKLKTFDSITFSNLKNLQALDLSNNNLLKLNMNLFTGLINLEHFFLANNNLSVIPFNNMNRLFPFLKYIEIEGNDLYCHHLTKMFSKLKRFSIQIKRVDGSEKENDDKGGIINTYIKGESYVNGIKCRKISWKKEMRNTQERIRKNILKQNHQLDRIELEYWEMFELLQDFTTLFGKQAEQMDEILNMVSDIKETLVKQSNDINDIKASCDGDDGLEISDADEGF